MNAQMIRYILGRMLGIEGLVLLIPMLIAILYHEDSWTSFLYTSVILLVIAFRRVCYRRIRLDLMVFVRGSAIYDVRQHSVVSQCCI